MYPHRIRLRGPWELEQPDKRRVTVPCRWSDLGITTGPILLRRRFGYPGQIDNDERVWLTFERSADIADARLNGNWLGNISSRPTEFDVTSLLRDRNQLEVEVQTPTAESSLGEVALEVRRTAYLRDVRADRHGQTIHITGTVVGFCEGPLDLYVLQDRSNLGYASVEAEPGGKSFEIDVTSPNPSGVRIELVRGAVVWYAVETEPAA